MAPFTETIPTLAQIPSPPLQDLTARLPAEVVLEVFLFVAAFKPSEHKQTPPSTRVSHVCRRWREIALQHQILWTTLSMPHFDGISMNLERSGTLPLTVHLIHVFPSKIPRRTYDHLALEALPRVRSLVFSLWPRYDYSTLWTRPAPRLESLTLTALRRRVGLSLVDFKRLTDDIFDAHVPRLRTLRLHACEIHPTSPLFSAQLRKLELKNIRCLFPTAPNLHDPEALLDALRTMPNLEELAIISPVSEKGWLERVVDEGPVVPLDRLCKLVLEDYASRISSFIRRLRRPTTCSVALRMINMHDEDLTAVSQSVDEALAPLRAAKFVYNKVHVSWEGVDPGYWYTNGGIEVVRIVVSEPEDPSLPAHLEMTIDVEEMDISPTLVALTHIFPPCVYGARLLVLDHPFFARADAWDKILRPFHAITEVAVCEEVAVGLCPASGGRDGESIKLGEVPNKLFPKLERTRLIHEEDLNEDAHWWESRGERNLAVRA